MTADCVLDTNVLIYAIDTDPEGALKKRIAMVLLETTDFGLSTRILQEFYVTATRKIRIPLIPAAAMAFIERFRAFPLVSTDFGLITEGIRNSVKFQVSYWDGAIIAAAERLQAKTLYTEDLSHDQHYGDVNVINPFVS